MVDASRYTYRVTWSEPDSEFVGTVAEFPSLSWLADTQYEALDGIIAVVREVVDAWWAPANAARADRGPLLQRHLHRADLSAGAPHSGGRGRGAGCFPESAGQPETLRSRRQRRSDTKAG